MSTYEDWREARAADLEPLYDAEAARWRDGLGWDYTLSCTAIEDARSAGRLPGVLARDENGAILGWTYFLLHNRRLQIGSLVGDAQATVSGLLRYVLRSKEAHTADGTSCFVYPCGPHVERALARARFGLSHHAYLCRTLSQDACDVPFPRPLNDPYTPARWSVGRLVELSNVVAEAYGTMPEARCFAPTGCPSEWLSYLGQIVHSPACGRFDAALTNIVLGPDSTIVGALVATLLDKGTAHIAQVVVSSEHRGKGLGRYLVEAVCARARACGCDRVTLIVAESNGAARELYDRLGFEQEAEFLFGWK